MVFAIHVSGGLGAPPGRLDTGVRIASLAEVIGVAQGQVEEQLRKRFQPREASGGYDFVIQLANGEEAKELIHRLQALVKHSDS